MTEHTFGEPAHHNDELHYVCKACSASRRVRSPGGPVGPYVILVDADAFPTCEAARMEAARIVEKRDRERLETQATAEEKYRTRQARLAAFCASYPPGFYWIQCSDGDVVVARLESYHEGERHWLFAGVEAGEYEVEFDEAEILSGPLSAPQHLSPTPSLAFLSELAERFGVSMRNVMNIVEATRLFDRNEWSVGRTIPLHRYEEQDQTH
jgi:hypothetical protein